MHTIIRDRTTHHADFVFYADRLLRLVGASASAACRSAAAWHGAMCLLEHWPLCAGMG